MKCVVIEVQARLCCHRGCMPLNEFFVGYEVISWMHYEICTGWICGLACAALLDACCFTGFCVY